MAFVSLKKLHLQYNYTSRYYLIWTPPQKICLSDLSMAREQLFRKHSRLDSSSVQTISMNWQIITRIYIYNRSILHHNKML